MVILVWDILDLVVIPGTVDIQVTTEIQDILATQENQVTVVIPGIVDIQVTLEFQDIQEYQAILVMVYLDIAE